MAVYAICTECGTRREKCDNLTAHKNAVRWTADVKFSRKSRRMRKTYDKKDLAESQERQWYTDHERGVLMPKVAACPTFAQVADEWWTMILSQNRIQNPNASEKYRVARFRDLFADRPVNQIELADGEDWISERVGDEYAVNTINRDLKPLRWIMKYAVRKGYIQADPFAELKELKGGNIRVRWMSEPEVHKLLQAAANADDTELMRAIMIGVNTGFRKGNLERLAARDINEGRITARKTKSGKPYDVPVSPAIAPLLNALCKERVSGPLLNCGNIDQRFRAVAKKAGLYPDPENGIDMPDEEKVTIHTLRHTFAALYLKRGGDLFKLSKLLGHSSIRVTEQTYAHVCPKDLDAQANLISTNVSLPVQFKIA